MREIKVEQFQPYDRPQAALGAVVEPVDKLLREPAERRLDALAQTADQGSGWLASRLHPSG